jgi:hypothetical protein
MYFFWMSNREMFMLVSLSLWSWWAYQIAWKAMPLRYLFRCIGLVAVMFVISVQKGRSVLHSLYMCLDVSVYPTHKSHKSVNWDGFMWCSRLLFGWALYVARQSSSCIFGGKSPLKTMFQLKVVSSTGGLNGGMIGGKIGWMSCFNSRKVRCDGKVMGLVAFFCIFSQERRPFLGL